ncbi:WD repeat-containing protein 44-like isoform X2 [Physella acuta]|uniref:WD repeat-containing protein 44-like isoform X2 n=1 Tax=Physella acuta TaxID=109671 RepID=UPI0027DE8ABE|nr:WD repeat-containing protein 44-like isoform X2 [Physella acuta]
MSWFFLRNYWAVDQEEFYDAADETSSSSSCHHSNSPKSITFSEIEEEERRLLQLKKRAEERRKREDEELERRLLQLQQQKRAEASNKEQDLHHLEHEGRIRKLEEMRQSLGADQSFFSTSNDSSLDKDSPNTSTDIPDLFALSGARPASAPKSRTIEKMENNGATTQTNRQHAKKRSGSWGDLPKNDSVLTIASGAEARYPSGNNPTDFNIRVDKPGSQGDISSPEGHQSGSDTSLPSAEASGGLVSVQRSSSLRQSKDEKLIDMDQNMERYHPEKEKQNKSLTLLISGSKLGSVDMGTDSVVDTILQQTQVQQDSEPDIVKSTKSRTPPFVKPPVAPPRKKKVKSQDLDECGTGRESTRPLHYDANIYSGSSGSPRVSPRSQAFSGTETLDDNMDSLSVQIQHWQSLGDGGREASPNRRPRSSSGRPLTDEEILELVTLRNLDTGETIPLSTAEDKLPKCVNPLALHIMRRTKEYSSDTSLHVDGLSDESDSRSEKSAASSSNTVRRKGMRIKKFFGKTVNKVKSVADSALQGDPPLEEEVSVDGKVFKIKSSSKNKGPYDFSQPSILQEMSGEHTGAIWTMKFSPCGKLLATGGQDSVLRIWVLKSTYTYFEDFRQKYSDVRLSPAVSHDSLNSASSSDLSAAAMDPLKELNKQTEDDEVNAPFHRKPFCVYKGHTADLLDISWSKNYFILSSSMDKTVRLWHISRRECLCTFQHIDFVTAIVFHPKDDRYFLSGSLDGKLRLWNIPDKKVTLWNELSGNSNLITTANFCYNGRLAVVGTYDGKCIFYTTEQLKYYTMVNVRSSRGKNSKGRKITGIESMPGEEKILITSNDSRIRLYNLRDLTLSCKYKGCMNNSSQIRASFSPTGKYVICGSEDHFLYVWKTNHEFIKFTSARRDRNDYWEAIKVHNAVVTSAVFAPNPSFIFRMAEQQNLELKGQPMSVDDDTEEREIIVSADFTGAMKVITNRPNSRSMFF